MSFITHRYRGHNSVDPQSEGACSQTVNGYNNKNKGVKTPAPSSKEHKRVMQDQKVFIIFQKDTSTRSQTQGSLRLTVSKLIKFTIDMAEGQAGETIT